MIATATYGSLADFYEAHRGEIDSAVIGARDEADRVVRQLPCGLDGDAFRGEAALAVWLAALAYRPEPGIRFASWAAITVNYALRQERRRQDWVSERRRRLLCAGLVEARASDLRPESLEEWFRRNGEGHSPWEEDRRPGPEAQVLRCEGAAYILEQVLALPRRDRDVLLLRFWGERTLTEIGAYLGVSTARAGQLVQSALVQLRRCFVVAGVSQTDF
jgi:RNA polymerase sigma factor (sigma-70 family)